MIDDSLRKIFLVFASLLLNIPVEAQVDSTKLARIAEQYWEFFLRENPLLATSVGEHRYDDRLPDMTEAAVRRRFRVYKNTLHRLDSIERGTLSEADRINYDFLRFMLENDTAEIAFRSYQVPINAEGGFHTAYTFALQRMPLITPPDYQNYIARLKAFGTYTDQKIQLMTDGIKQGRVPPRVVVKNALATVSPPITENTEAHELYKAFLQLPDRFSATERQQLQEAAQQALESTVIPAMKRLQAFLQDDYLPQAYEEIGISHWPRGKERYAQRIRYYTTLSLTPDQVYEQGLREVERILGEMQTIIDSLNFSGSYADFLEFLRTDPRFYATSPEELLQRAAWLAKQIDGQLPRLFGRLPRLPYGVEPVPADIAPTYTVGRYVAGSPEAHRAGTYWVNTYQLDSRPLYALPALTLHEAVPGHHLQIALAQEMEGVPAFRRHSYLSAFGEGWGLYAESLGDELGVYTTLYQQFGRLTYEMWRACRLVVDVGIHDRGWTRERAVRYMAERTALSRHEVNTEIDRYIGWPGQAVSYKIGELKIKELRQRAETKLGGRFDIRQFHDVVLQNGSVPLFVLEKQVEQYIADQL